MEQPKPRRRKAVVDGVRRKLQAYRKPTVRIDALLRLHPGLGELFDKDFRSQLLSRRQVEKFSSQKRTHVWGIVRRAAIFHRYCYAAPRYYLPSTADHRLLDPFASTIHQPKIFIRLRENVRAALSDERIIPGGNLLAAFPRRKTPSLAYTIGFLNSPVVNFFLDAFFEKGIPPLDRLVQFKVPLLKKVEADHILGHVQDILTRVRRVRDLSRQAEDVEVIAKSAGVTLVPLEETEGILREINVPRSLGEIVEIKRRGPVVIFRRGSTIVTTTEESATYLELWLADRFHEIQNLNKAELGQHIRMPALTAYVVRVLQHRARLDEKILKLTTEIDSLQDEIDSRIYDVYLLSAREREFLGMFYV
ncbi:MAG: hypothetical protein H0V09_09845 [Gemmatimonadetes bacterium]|nr:hypothetical protein [Gemmatimonadota bacterium]